MQHQPTPPSIRNAEQRTPSDRREQAYWDEILSANLAKRTTVQTPPSLQMQAHRDYEVAKFGIMGRRGSPSTLGYNLYDDSTRLLGMAYRFLTDDPRTTRALTGFTPKTVPRRALGFIAKAYGYRYLRGLEVIEHNLANGAQQVKFRHERMEFRHALELNADAAHAINDKGQNRAAALEVVMMFANELLALCPWLERMGHEGNAKWLRQGVTEAITRTEDED
jgi:hypothetical protein